MKQAFFIIVISLIVISAFAQGITKEDIEIVQSVFGKNKKELVKKYMILPAAQNDKFWTLYEAYETKRKNLGTTRIAILQSYAQSYDKLNDKTAEDLALRTLENDIATDKLHAEYFKKMAAAIGGVNAAKFFQLESYLQNIIRVNTQDQIPFIGELNKTKKTVPESQM